MFAQHRLFVPFPVGLCTGDKSMLLLIAFIWRYSPLSSRLIALACHSTRVTSFLQCVFKYPPKWCVRTYTAGMVSASRICCRLGALCTPYNQVPCHFMQSHIRKVHACLAVTCQLVDSLLFVLYKPCLRFFLLPLVHWGTLCSLHSFSFHCY